MKGRVPANLAPLPRCSPVPLGLLVGGQILKRRGVAPPASQFFRNRKLLQLGALRARKV